MAIETELQYARVDDLYLDPNNPRLGREHSGLQLPQSSLLELMADWTLDELAISFLENGFWPQEALLVIEEEIDGEKRLVVVEGNRRLAALKLLFAARNGSTNLAKMAAIASTGSDDSFQQLETVPYIKAESRDEIQTYLGFRHVTGIKPWEPAEKAEFIAKLIEDYGFSYDQVRRQIGSKLPTVRQNYISYRLLLQMESVDDRISLEKVENRFSVLYLSIRTAGVQNYLSIDIQASPEAAKKPVPPEKIEHLVKFAEWLFGTETKNPVVQDSRNVDRFGTVLESAEATAYLERAERPNLDVAYRRAGGEEAGVIDLVEQASYDVQEALRTAHHHVKVERLEKAVRVLGSDVMQLLSLFPEVKKDILAGKS